MFLFVDDDGPLAHHGLVVARVALHLLEWAVEHLSLLQALDVVRVVELDRVGPLPEVRPGHHLGVGVVHRQAPAQESVPPEIARAAAVHGVHRPGLGDVGQQVLLYPEPEVVADAPGDRAIDREIAVVIPHVALDPPVLGELRPVHQGVQIHGMHRVDPVLRHLQPVAGKRAGIGHHLEARRLEGIVDGKLGRALGWAHIGEEQSLVLLHRIGALADVLEDRGLRGLRRRLQQRAVDVVEPAVIAAADAALLDVAELQRGATMGAVLLEQAHASRLVPEQHQVLAQDPHRKRQLSQLRGHGDSVPEAPQVLPRRRASRHVGEFRVLSRVLLIVVARVMRSVFALPCHGCPPCSAGFASIAPSPEMPRHPYRLKAATTGGSPAAPKRTGLPE